MSTALRTDVFAALAELSKRYPHWRMGQLLSNVAGWADTEVWHVEDEQILSAARAHLEGLASANGVQSEPVPSSATRNDGRETSSE
jgi:hypothetical protein